MLAGVCCTALLKIRTLVAGERRVGKTIPRGLKPSSEPSTNVGAKVRPPKHETYHTNSLTELHLRHFAATQHLLMLRLTG
jgi:hypothetical protein